MHLNLHKISPWNWFKKEGEVVPIQNKRIGTSLPVQSLHQDIDRIFNDFMSASDLAEFDKLDRWPGTNVAFKPRVDIEELKDKYHIEVEVPGVDQKDVKIELDDDTLMVSGEKSHRKENNQGNYHRMECSYGAFKRTMTLPENADKESIQAHFKNGVLSIDITKDTRARSLTREIEIA